MSYTALSAKTRSTTAPHENANARLLRKRPAKESARNRGSAPHAKPNSNATITPMAVAAYATVPLPAVTVSPAPGVVNRFHTMPLK